MQFYEDQDQCRSKLTVISRRLACTDNLNNNNNISSSNASASISKHNNNSQSQTQSNSNSNISNSSISNGQSLTMSTSMSNMVEATAAAAAAAAATAAVAGGGGGGVSDTPSSSAAPATATSQHQSRALATYLQPSSTLDGDNPRRRRASDCSAVQAAAAISNQLHCITLKNNNCTAAAAAGKLPFHRGSCGAAGEHLLAANSIANRATIILSKSCSNVDGDTTAGTINAANVANKLRASATDIESNSVSALNGARDAMATIANAAAAAASNNGNNGNNEYSILQLNNTIIQCHFNDDDFRALVKDLKRKVEYTERMNWLCEYRIESIIFCIFAMHFFFF